MEPGKPNREVPGTPHNPEIKPGGPERPRTEPKPEIKPTKEPTPTQPVEVPPSKL